MGRMMMTMMMGRRRGSGLWLARAETQSGGTSAKQPSGKLVNNGKHSMCSSNSSSSSQQRQIAAAPTQQLQRRQGNQALQGLRQQQSRASSTSSSSNKSSRVQQRGRQKSSMESQLAVGMRRSIVMQSRMKMMMTMKELMAA
jgi:hypothetical protein